MFGWGASKEPEWSYPELDSPSTDDDFRAIVDRCLTRAKDLYEHSEGWTRICEEDGISLDERPVEGTPVHLVKCSGNPFGSF